MTATHKVKTADQNTIGFLVDGVFYSIYYIRQNIAYISNLYLDENGMPASGTKLPELDYKKHIIDQTYHKLVKENPFVRDVQEELSEWKEDRLHQVLQLGEVTENCLTQFQFIQWDAGFPMINRSRGDDNAANRSL